MAAPKAADKDAGAVAADRRTAFLKHGVTVDPDITVAQALKQGGLDYEVELVDIKTADGHKIPNRRAVRRKDTGAVFDVVGTGYSLVQNAEAFGVVDGYKQVLDTRFGAAGTTAGGRTAWMTLQLPMDLMVCDEDPHEMHLIVETSHDGKRAVRTMVTPIRLACLNQMNLAISRAHQRWAVRHTSTAQGHLLEAHTAAGYVEEYVTEFKTGVTKLLSYNMSEKSLTQFLETVLPDRPKKEKEVAAIKGLALNAATCEFGRGTGYAALNAVREYFDHVRPQRTTESAFIGAMQGQNKRVADRAYALLSERAAKQGHKA